MNFKDTVMISMLAYPSIMPTVSAVLFHRFFAAGNGCTWKNGEIVDYNSTYTRESAIRKSRKSLKESVAWAVKTGSPGEVEFRRRLHDFEFVAKNIDEIFEQDHWRIDFQPSIYQPWSEFALICNIPDDIQKDWFDAAHSCTRALLQSLPRIQISEEHIRKSWEENLPKLMSILTDLGVRKGWCISEKQYQTNLRSIIDMLKDIKILE